MTKRILTAIRSLPDDYVADGTEFLEFNGWVVAVNRLLPPIKHHPDSGWTKLDFTSEPTNPLDNRPSAGQTAPTKEA